MPFRGPGQIDDPDLSFFFEPLGQFHQAPVMGEKEHLGFLGEFGRPPKVAAASWFNVWHSTLLRCR
jgi:hypothetical protein